MRIVFLDIDGVLVTWDSMKNLGMVNRLHRFQPSCVAALNKLTRASGASIVVSSTWRLGNAERFAELVHYMSDQGIEAPVLGRTPHLVTETPGYVIGLAEPRGVEIQHWLDHADCKVESFVILDDDSDMAHLTARLIQTSMESGLTDAHAERASLLLQELPK